MAKNNEKVIRVYGKEKTKNDGTKYVEYSYTVASMSDFYNFSNPFVHPEQGSILL